MMKMINFGIIMALTVAVTTLARPAQISIGEDAVVQIHKRSGLGGESYNMYLANDPPRERERLPVEYYNNWEYLHNNEINTPPRSGPVHSENVATYPWPDYQTESSTTETPPTTSEPQRSNTRPKAGESQRSSSSSTSTSRFQRTLSKSASKVGKGFKYLGKKYVRQMDHTSDDDDYMWKDGGSYDSD